jgi:VanZ family protein
MELSHPAKVKRVLRGLWLLAILVVVAGSLLPSDSEPIKALDYLPFSDKADHFVAYAALAFLPAIHEKRRFFIAAAIGAVALGVALEYAQLYSGWRDFEVADMVADAIGAGFGLLVGVPLRTTAILRAVFAGHKGLTKTGRSSRTASR